MGEKWRVAAEKMMEMGEDEVRRIWKDYFEDLYNMDTQEQVAVHIYGLDDI